MHRHRLVERPAAGPQDSGASRQRECQEAGIRRARQCEHSGDKYAAAEPDEAEAEAAEQEAHRRRYRVSGAGRCSML